MDTQERKSPGLPIESRGIMSSGDEVLPDLFRLRTLMVNLCFAGEAGSKDWVLVDAGLAGFGEQIVKIGEERFGQTPPKAIILTHGHFDHIGSLETVLQYWDVPVYAHRLELPYLTGEADYPPADPTVGGGLMARVSPLYSNKGIDLGNRVRALPKEGRLPVMPGWRWVHTPGHTEGHISLFRDVDRALIAGDAFITVKQESALAVLVQEKEIHGPPTYFTTDWDSARESVKLLDSLKPSVVITGHGVPMSGEGLSRGLKELTADFNRLAIPDHGRYVH